MSNLIITIISIGLVAIAATMGIYYGGVAYSNAQINATANAIMNESQQILFAERMWSTNNGQPDISGMGTSGASGTGMSMLVAQKELTTWPFVSALVSGPLPYISSGASTVTAGSYDKGTYSILGYTGTYRRIMFSVAGRNYVYYEFDQNASVNSGDFITSATDVSQINHPIVKIALAINAALGQLPNYTSTMGMASLGLPYLSGYYWQSPNNGTVGFYDTANNYVAFYGEASNQGQGPIIATNLCLLANSGTTDTFIQCIFGPS